MSSDSAPLTLEEFLEILKEQIRIVDRAIKRLTPPDRDRLRRLLFAWFKRTLSSSPSTLADIVDQIRNSLATVEETFESGFQSEEFRKALSLNPAASKKIDAYYDIVDEGAKRLSRVVLYLPETSPTTGEGASVTGVAEEFGEYAERTSSRVKAHRDNLIISESSLYVEGIPAPTKTWSITLQSPVGKKDGFLTPREFYYLLFHCQARRSKVDQAMTRGCGIDTAVIDSMPDGPKRHLQSIPYAWMGDPREGSYSSNVADQQSKMKSAVNNQVSNEIIIYEDEHYSLNPNLSLDRVHIPALKLP
ncbi:hypothetical protein ES705_10682 [subsurface metagenome]